MVMVVVVTMMMMIVAMSQVVRAFYFLRFCFRFHYLLSFVQNLFLPLTVAAVAVVVVAAVVVAAVPQHLSASFFIIYLFFVWRMRYVVTSFFLCLYVCV